MAALSRIVWSALAAVLLCQPATALDRKIWTTEPAPPPPGMSPQVQAMLARVLKPMPGELICHAPSCGGTTSKISVSLRKQPPAASFQAWEARERRIDQYGAITGTPIYFDQVSDLSTAGGAHYRMVMHSYSRTSTTPNWTVSGYVVRGSKVYDVYSWASSRAQAEANYAAALDLAK